MMAVFSVSIQAQQMPPIPVDDAVRIGKLDNGLTYYIRHNDYPEHRVNFYIAQRVGTMQEDDNQQGLAHFLEHMAFNGSEHFPGLGILDFTRSLGLNFGGDLNAGTGFTHTVYNVNNVPSTRQSALDSCLLILKDWSHGLLLEDKDIDEERGVIHQEWRQTTDAKERMDTRQLKNIFPGSKYGERMIIGLMDIVDNFPYQVLRDYYHKWYRPDNQALVIVGDVDVDYMEGKIQEMFKDIPAPAADAAKVEDYPVPDNEQPIFVVDKDKEQSSNMLFAMYKYDNTPREAKVGIDYLLMEYAGEMASEMMTQRLQELAQDPDCPFVDAGSIDNNFLWTNTKNAFYMIAMPKDGQAEATMQLLATECRRAVEHGFTETEYARAKDEYMSRLESEYNERNKVSNETYAQQYYMNYLENEPIPSVEQKYQIMSMIIPNIPVEVINGYLSEVVDPSGRNLVVTCYNTEKDGAVYPTQESLKAAFDKALAAPVEAYVDNVKQEPLMAQLPKAGKIVKETENSQFGYKQLELSNGVRVILKKTDFKEDEIMMQAVQRGGESLYDEKDWANLKLYDGVMSMCGLGEFSRNELTKALAGKQVDVSASIETYNDIVSGESTIKDLETMFQLTYLTFTDVRKDEKAFGQLKNMMEAQLKSKDQVPEAAMGDTLTYVLSNRDWRGKPFNAENLQQVSLDRIMQIAKERTANAASYTFYFVGSFDEATIRPLIEQYIASLPAKKGKKSNWVNVETHPQGDNVIRFERQMETPKTSIQSIWYDDKTPYSLEHGLRAQMLGKVLDKIYTQLIREDAGAAYSLMTMGNASLEGDNPFAILLAYCPIKPEFTEQTIEILDNQLIAAGKSIDVTTLNEVKNELIKDHESALKENGYWMRQLLNYVERGIDNVTGYEQIVKAQTPETVAAYARHLKEAGSKVEVIMTPK